MIPSSIRCRSRLADGDSDPRDAYTLDIGIRTVEVRGDRLCC